MFSLGWQKEETNNIADTGERRGRAEQLICLNNASYIQSLKHFFDYKHF